MKFRSIKSALIAAHLFISTISWGQSDYCQGLPVGGRSLYAPGGSLYGVTQQDQDGLETCYANVASLVAKSYNPSLPTPSYLHLAGFNIKDAEKSYDFDFGNVCTVLEEVKKTSGKLCGTSILENLPTIVQGETLYRLYDAINKYGYSPYDTQRMIQNYESLLKISPAPDRIKCEEEGGLDVLPYVRFQFELLDSAISYSVDEAWGEEEDRCAEIVGSRMKELWGQKGLSPERSAKISHLYIERLKNTKLPSGESHYDFIIGLTDSMPNKNAAYQLVLGDETIRSFQYKNFLEGIVKVHDRAVFDDIRKELADGSPQVKACLDRGEKNWIEPNPGLFFNTITKACHKSTELWRSQVREATKSCTEGEEELFLAFRNLTNLGVSIDEIKNFIVKNDQNILKQIIENNCKEFHEYSLPSQDCQFQQTPPGLAGISTPEEWEYYQKFKLEMEDFLKLYKLSKELVDLNKFIEFWVSKYNVEPAPMGENETEVYRKLIFDMITNITKKHPGKAQFSYKQIMAETKSIVVDYQGRQKSGVKKIVESIRNGKAIGVATCSAMFTDREKGNYPGCYDHSVTATGVECVNGKLQVELTNSWGIGCRDEEKSKDVYRCQRDENGLTNGRSWVDIDYLSRQGFSLYSF